MFTQKVQLIAQKLVFIELELLSKPLINWLNKDISNVIQRITKPD